MAKNTNSIVEVKRKHIRNGVPGEPNSCAIALAVEEKFKGAEVGVDGSYIYVHTDNGTTTYECPRSAKRFINRFDAIGEENPTTRVKPAPFAFRLRKAS